MTDTHGERWYDNGGELPPPVPPYRYPDTGVFHVERTPKQTLEDPPYWNLTEFPPVLILAAGIAGGFGLGVLLTIVFLQAMWGIR